MKIMKTLLAVILLSVSIFPLAAEAKTNFKDVTQDFWAKEDINFLAERKIIFGYSNGDFGVGDHIRRSDAAVMIVRALAIDTKNRPNPKFKDVTPSSYAYDAIAAVTDEEIFYGNNGEFKPSDTLTRAEMAAILTRAFQLTGKGEKVSFKDVPQTAWHYASVQALVAHGVTFGYSDNTFRPTDRITRAQFSAFLTRAIKQMPQEQSLKVVKIY